MKCGWTLSVILPAASLLLASGQYVAGQNFPNCGDGAVHYSPFDASFSKRILVEATGDGIVPVDGVRQYAPQRTSWLTIVEPDTTKSGPWTTAIFVASLNNHMTQKISFIDHSEYPVQVQWLNEKLLFGRVFRGRVLATDFILDVQTRKFMYEEMASYVGLSNPCQ